MAVPVVDVVDASVSEMEVLGEYGFVYADDGAVVG